MDNTAQRPTGGDNKGSLFRMSDPDRGLYEKYEVRRHDWEDAPGLKHEHCQYFVLDLTHDPFAMPAIRSYAAACAEKYPLLAADLIQAADRLEGTHDE